MPSDICNLCNVNRQTQFHVLNKSLTAATSRRYVWKHNSILCTMDFYLSQLPEIGYSIYVDIEGLSNPTEVFRQFIADMVLVKNKFY